MFGLPTYINTYGTQIRLSLDIQSYPRSIECVNKSICKAQVEKNISIFNERITFQLN